MAVGAVSPFRPTGTVSLSATTTSGNVPLLGGGDSVVVTNATSAVAYVRFGTDSSVTASASDMPILPSTHAMLCINPLVSYGAGVLTSGSGSLLFTRGDGSFV